MKIKNILALFIAALALTAFTGCDDDCDDKGYEFKKNVTVDTSDVEVDPGQNFTAVIMEGNGNYTVRSTNDLIATASMSGNSINITGVASGKASIIITDEKGVNAIVNVLVYGDLILETAHLDMLTNKTDNIAILSGNGGYRFENAEPNIELSLVEDPLLGTMIAVTTNDTELTDVPVTVYDRTGRSASFTVTVVDPYTVIKADETLRMEYKTYYKKVADNGTSGALGQLDIYNDNTTYAGYHRFGWREGHNYRKIEVRIPTTQDLTTLGLKTGGQIKYDFDNYSAGDGYISSWGSLNFFEVIKYDSGKVWIVFSYTKSGTGAGTWQGVICMDI